MKPAQERLAEDLRQTQFRDLSTPLINNWQAREVHTAAEARQGLIEQVPNPVRWVETVRLLASLGVTGALEVGAGGVLSGLVRQIDSAIACQRFGEAADWEKLG